MRARDLPCTLVYRQSIQAVPSGADSIRGWDRIGPASNQLTECGCAGLTWTLGEGWGMECIQTEPASSLQGSEVEDARPQVECDSVVRLSVPRWSTAAVS